MRGSQLATGIACVCAMLAATATRAEDAAHHVRPARSQARTDAELSSQNRVVRHRPRVRIYREDSGHSYLPPDAVRECTAHYVQEYRPSGTVIVPRMNCFWRRG